MNKIQFLMILCMIGMMQITHAQQQVSENEARNAAISTLYNKTELLKRSSDTEIDTVYTLSNSRSNVLMYEVVFKNRSAILLSGSKACLPVLGYYTKSEHDKGSVFDTTNTNVSCCLHAFLQDYMQELEHCFAQKAITLQYEEQWRELQNTDVYRGTPPTTIIVDALLTTKWGQSISNDMGKCDAYNYYVTATHSSCPSCNYVNRCYAGCVAVAMAQTIKYWNYPVYMSNMSYQYDWCNMSDSLLISSPNYEKKRNAIARLIKDCGEKTQTVYCSRKCSATSGINKVYNALLNDFGYSSNAVLLSKEDYNNVEGWKNLIKANLDAATPVFYQALSNSSGHAFVCDGYGSDGMFHFNWGWTGRYDGWFAIDNLNPMNSYNSGHIAIFNAYPSTFQNYCNFTSPLWMHFSSGGTQENVPKTFTVLESVPESYPASWRTIESGQSAEYVAHKEIRLKPGFRAKAGSNFRARIEPCDGCNNRELARSVLFIGNEETSDIGDFYYDTIPITTKKLLLQEEEKENPNPNGAITLYPNPNTGSFTITGEDINEIEVFNLLGQSIYSVKNPQTYTINLPNAAKGTFFVRITTSKESVTKKVVVQ